ncbi:MAG TPA: hypothetical protein VGT61_11985 [Thermomicrobiales bacterium]|jgi:hypothetical protein|nr:hypothetical protein [Thermomicrobiales bacterium]
MADALRVAIEVGPKGKRSVAVAPGWPGLERGAKTEQAAIDRLLDYLPRYAPVARLAGLADSLPASGPAEVVEHYPGTGSTDFWGLSFAFSDHDKVPVTSMELDRELALMRSAWQFFDDVRARVSPVLRKGPRGGGRDRDQIVSHVFGNERDWAGGVGVQTPPGVMLTDEGLATHRTAYVDGIRAFHADGRTAGKWPLRYLIRHTAYHTLDHAWEMEDKDLTGEPS